MALKVSKTRIADNKGRGEFVDSNGMVIGRFPSIFVKSRDMHELYHHCLNALTGMKAHIRAHRRAPNERIAEKEWQIILAAMKRIEDALDAHRKNGKIGS